MINVVIPMAGAGSRFTSAGYTDPKPLIKISGVPMIKVVVENIRPSTPHRFIFICQKQHVKDYDLERLLTEYVPGCTIVQLDGLTEGAACTVLQAKEFINNNNPLMIANSDQYIDIDINEYLDSMHQGGYEGFIMTMKANDPKWSFVGFDGNGSVTEVVEKKVISDEATVGIYNFSTGEDFVKAAEAMIANNDRVNNEFYVAPVYNYMIRDRKKIGIYNVGTENNGMYGLGTPTDLEHFISTSVCQKATLK